MAADAIYTKLTYEPKIGNVYTYAKDVSVVNTETHVTVSPRRKLEKCRNSSPSRSRTEEDGAVLFH